MNKKYRLFLNLFGIVFVGFLFSCVSTPPYQAIPAPVTQESGGTELAELLNSIRFEERIPGLAAAIIVDGKLYSAAAVGVREVGTENWLTINDKFLIGSCSKAFTATTAAVLVEEGRLSWDTTIRDVFPDLDMFPEYENITIEQLLSHRAGLPKNLKEGKASWLIDYEFDEHRGSSPESLRMQYLEKTLHSKLIHPPGQAIHYSNSGYLIVGSILEKISGQAYGSLRADKVFQPLDIKTAGYGIPADVEASSQPWGHIWDLSSSFIVYRSDYPNFFSPTGYMHLSIEDWAKFILAHIVKSPLENQNFLKSDTLSRLHTPPDTKRFNQNSWKSPSYAMGWFTFTKGKDHNLIFHGGRGLAFNAHVMVDLKTKNAILIVTNSDVGHIHPDKQIMKMHRKIKKHYSDRFELPYFY